MLTKHDVDVLLRRDPTPESPVLSVYLFLDRSQGLNAQHQMATGLRQMLKAVEQQLHGGDHKQFNADAAAVLQFLTDHKPRRLSLAVFADQSAQFFQSYDLNAPVRSGVWWERTPHVRPLLEVLDEYERFGVVLTDKSQARLFTVFLGEVEEHREAFAANEVKHIRKISRDRLRSQATFQRKAQTHILWHHKNVADMLERLEAELAFDRLVLAGPVESTSALRRLLSKRLRTRVVGTINLPLTASEQQVLEATLKIEQEIERAAERDMVAELITAAAKQNHATLGLASTLEALQEGRVWQLVYVDGLTRRGCECPSCASLFEVERETCSFCEAQLAPVEDLIGRMAERVMNDGGRVEPVLGDAAQQLQAAGGIAAFLRF